MLAKYGRLLVLYTLLFISLSGNMKILPHVYAHSYSTRENAKPGPMLMSNWFHHVTATNADGGSWLWGWAWGTDNTVSVVDLSPPVNFVSRPASFGKILEDAVNGYGIPMNAFTVLCNETEKGDAVEGIGPNLGCPRLCPSGNHLPRAEESWIAIVQRGNCSFVAKVREAQRFGAKAVIVGGDDPAISGNPDVLVNMYSQSDASDVKIPSTYIKFSDYTHLSYLIATSNTSTSGLKTVSIQITADYASWEWYSPILTFIVLLLLPSVLTLTTLFIHRIRAARAEQRERAPEDVVNRLPWRVWTGSGWEKHEGPVPPPTTEPNGKANHDVDLERGDLDLDDALEAQQFPGRQGAGQQCKPSTSHDEEADTDRRSVNPPWFDAQTECAICLSDFERGDRVRVLPCKHIFHLEEVDEWLIHRKKLCPVCKADVTQPPQPYVHLHAELGPQPPIISNTNTSMNTNSILSPVTDERTPLLSCQSQRTRSVNFALPNLEDDQPPTPYSYTRAPSPSPSRSSLTTSSSQLSDSTARPRPNEDDARL